MDLLEARSLFVQHWVAISAGAVFTISLARIFYNRKTGKYPPGPPAWPVIGNILDIPAEYPWKVYRKWGQEASESLVLEICSHWKLTAISCG
jgi:hypothetical protein